MNDTPASRGSDSYPPLTAITGGPCPPWCTTDHAKPVFPDGSGVRSHVGNLPAVQLRGGYIAAWPAQFSAPGSPGQVAVSGTHYVDGTTTASTPPVYLAPADAGALASIIWQLAGASRAKHRELATAIRAAAAIITGASQDGSAR